MGTKLTLNPIAGGYQSTAEISANNTLIENEFDNTLSLDGTTPNSMGAQLDMNSNKIINLAEPTAASDAARKVDVDAVTAAGLPAQTAHASQFLQTDGSAASWQVPAGTEVSNTPAGSIAAVTVQAAIDELDTEKLAVANNLSDVADAPTSRTNLGLGTIATQSAASVAITGGSVTGITDLAIADGGTGASTAQAAIDALSQVSGATDEYILTKDTGTGNALWKVNPGASKELKSITASVATNALTVGLAADSIYFRDSTLTSGTATAISFSALTLTVPDTATLGTTSAVAARLYILAINNAGTVELAIVNASGGVSLTEEGVISTTAISITADSATVIYSTTARTNVAYRVVGFINITEATAGTWATAPTTIGGAGGNTLSAMSSFGYGQTWQDLTGSRSAATTYYNTTGKPIGVMITGIGTDTNITAVVGGVTIGTSRVIDTGTVRSNLSFIVSPGESYSLTVSTGTISIWAEKR